MISASDLQNWFTYHPPNENDVARYQLIRDAALGFAVTVLENTPPSADQTVAIRKIREAVMVANASIACRGK